MATGLVSTVHFGTIWVPIGTAYISTASASHLAELCMHQLGISWAAVVRQLRTQGAARPESWCGVSGKVQSGILDKVT